METQAVLARAFVCYRNVCSTKVAMMASCSLISEWKEFFSFLRPSSLPSMVMRVHPHAHHDPEKGYSAARKNWHAAQRRQHRRMDFSISRLFSLSFFPFSAAFCRNSAFMLLLVFDLWLCIRWNERKLARMSVKNERHTFVIINSLCKQKWNCFTRCFFDSHSLGLRLCSFIACKQTHNSQNGKVKPRQSSLSSCSPPSRPLSRYSFRMCSWFVCSFSLTQNSHFHTVYASAVRCGASIASPFVSFWRFASVDCLAKSQRKRRWHREYVVIDGTVSSIHSCVPMSLESRVCLMSLTRRSHSTCGALRCSRVSIFAAIYRLNKENLRQHHDSEDGRTIQA